jgi:hypothetical protein
LSPIFRVGDALQQNFATPFVSWNIYGMEAEGASEGSA